MSDEQIYRDLHRDLTNFAAAVATAHDADDIVSAVVLRVLAQRPLAALDDPRSYLFRSVLNEARSLHRRQRRTHTSHRQRAATSSTATVEPQILAAVLGLPPQQRAVTYLVYWMDLSVGDAAALIGVRSGTAKRYLHLARSTLQGLLHDL